MEPELTQPGRRVAGRYQLVETLGKGGYATVWRAIDLETGASVAMKLLHRPFRGSSFAIERFGREVEVLMRLEHPAIARPVGFSLEGDTPWFAMELVVGEPLQRVIGLAASAGRHLAPDTLAAALRPIALALDYAHAQGVVHRDVKPANIMVTERGGVLLDFGIAKLPADDAAAETTRGRAIGSFAYMAVEQVRGEAVDARTDVYGLSVVLYEALTLRRAWHLDAEGRPLPAYTAGSTRSPRNAVPELMQRVSTEARPIASQHRPGLDPAIDALLVRGMALDPAERPSSATRLVDGVLERLVASEPTRGPRLDLSLYDPTRAGFGPSGTAVRSPPRTGTALRDEPSGTEVRGALLGAAGGPGPDPTRLAGPPGGDPTRLTGPDATRLTGAGTWTGTHASPRPSLALPAALLGLAVVLGVGAVIAASRRAPLDDAPLVHTAPMSSPGARPGVVVAPPEPALELPDAGPVAVAPEPSVAATPAPTPPRPRPRPAVGAAPSVAPAPETAPPPTDPVVGLRLRLAQLRRGPLDPAALSRLVRGIRAAAAELPAADRKRIEAAADTSAMLGDLDGLGRALDELEAAR